MRNLFAFWNAGINSGIRLFKTIVKNNINRLDARVFNDEIERRRGIVSHSTVENELTAFRSLLTFARSKGVTELTTENIIRYERWLRDKGVKPNTSACYMRSLRAVCNRLGMNGKEIFGGVRTAKDKARKRAVGKETIQKLESAEVAKDSFQELARDAFLFSIMAMGIPFVDLAHLRKSDYKDGLITYNRRKTGKQVTIEVEPCMAEMINRYSRSDTPYLFPLLTKTEPVEAEREYSSLLSRYNRALTRLSEKEKLQKTVSSYTARHTWATMAFRNGLELSTISKGLGHASPVTTQNYLKEIDDEALSEANRLLIMELFGEN